MTANSFDEGVLLGLLLGGSGGETGNKPVIKSLTVTTNGTYTAPSGVDGYSPVYVNVPDRYDEGYQKGYDEGYEDGGNDTRDEIANNPDDPTHKEIYEDGKSNGEYTFPEGTEYEDIVNFIGDDTVVDKTLGYGVSTIYKISESDPTRMDVMVVVVDSNGKYITNIKGSNAPVEDDWRVENIHVYSDGWCEITWSYLKNDGTRGTTSNSGYSKYLVGFGESGHTFGVSNS